MCSELGASEESFDTVPLQVVGCKAALKTSQLV